MGSGVVCSDPWPHLEFSEFLDPIRAEHISTFWPTHDWIWLKHSDVVRPDGTSLRRYQHLKDAHPFSDFLRIDFRAYARSLLDKDAEEYFRDSLDVDGPLYPVVLLVEDAPGYKIRRHTDCAGKRISAQVYLPETPGHEDNGVILQTLDGSKSKQIPYRFNHGYAFKVTNSSWHRVAPATVTRRSLQLIYYDTPNPVI